MNKLFLITTILVLLMLSACSDNYENHALAFRNNTSDTILVSRYFNKNTTPRIFKIAPSEYAKIYETTTELWITPAIELQKNSDSISIQGKLDEKNFTIIFKKAEALNYCSNPYSSDSEWETEIKVEEYPKLFGKKLERFYIHIFNVNPQCITTADN